MDSAGMDAEDDADDSQALKRGKAATARQQAIDDWQWLMASKQGRRLAHRMLSAAGLRRKAMGSDSEIRLQEGRRALGLELENEIVTHAFPAYLDMLKEQGLPR